MSDKTDKTYNMQASIQIREVNNLTRTQMILDNRFLLKIGAMTEVWDRTLDKKVHSARNLMAAIKWVAHWWESQHDPASN